MSVSGLRMPTCLTRPKHFRWLSRPCWSANDFVASMALLIRWLSQADHVPLERADSSFHQLAQQWLLKLLERGQIARRGGPAAIATEPGTQVLRLPGGQCGGLLECTRFSIRRRRRGR